MNIPKVEYDIYSKLSGTKLEKLNISICDNSKISLLIPLIITENLDILDSKSEYYNDICYTTTSESGTDITLKDRKNEYIDCNKMICQDNCEFSGYNKNSLFYLKITSNNVYKLFERNSLVTKKSKSTSISLIIK